MSYQQILITRRHLTDAFDHTLVHLALILNLVILLIEKSLEVFSHRASEATDNVLTEGFYNRLND